MESIAKIKEKVNIAKKTVAQIKELERLSLEVCVDAEDRKIIDQKILKLKSTLKIGAKIKENELDEILNKYDLDSSLLENLKVEYLIDKCIIKGEITMIVAPPGAGKSSFALSVATKCLKDNVLKSVIYLDLDNSLITLADRKINQIQIKFKNKFKYLHGYKVSKAEMLHILNTLNSSFLNSYLVVFDSAKNFLGDGKDRDSNKDVTEFMNIIKSIRENGATVLLLHHVNKPQKDMDTVFAGAAAWMEDVSSSFVLEQNKYKNCFILRPTKQRVGDLAEIAFLFNKSENIIEEIDLFFAKETIEDEEIRNVIYDYLKRSEIKQTYSQILEYCTKDCGFSKNKVNAVIQAAKHHYWESIKEKHNHNRDVFVLLDNSDRQDK